MKALWRWMWRLAAAGLVIILLALAAAQAVLWTDIPRRIAASQIRDKTGLVVELGEFKTTLRGRTRIEGLSLTIPGAAEALVTVDQAEITHTSLWWLLLGADAQVYHAQMMGGAVELVEDGPGRWNVLTAAELFRRGEVGGRLLDALEWVRVEGVRGRVRRADGRELTLEPIEVELKGIGPGAVAGYAQLGERFRAEGSVLTRGSFAHEAQVSVVGANDLLGMVWERQGIEVSRVLLGWSGRVVEGGVEGRLELDELTVEGGELEGTAGLVWRDGAWTVRPERVVFRAGPEGEMTQTTVQGGIVTLTNRVAAWRGVMVEAAGSGALVEGSFDLAAESGRITAEWAGRLAGESIAHQGNLRGEFERGLEGWRGTATVISQGEAPMVGWRGEAQVRAWQGLGRAVRWSVQGNDGEVGLTLSEEDPRGRLVEFEELSARGEVDWPAVVVEEVAIVSDGSVRGSGAVNFETGVWHARVDATQLQVREVLAGAIDITGLVKGDRAGIELEGVLVRGRQFELGVSGSFERDEASGGKLAMEVEAEVWSDAAGGIAGLDILEGESANGGKNASVAGAGAIRVTRVSFAGGIHGALEPRALAIEGSASAAFRGPADGSERTLAMTIRGEVDEDRVTAISEPFEVFEGEGQLRVIYEIESDAVRVATDLEGVSLGAVLGLVNPQAGARGEASMELALSAPRTRLRDLKGEGRYRIRGLAYKEFAFDEMSGSVSSPRAGVIDLDPIELHQGQGRAVGSATIRLGRRMTASAALEVAQWPVELARFGLGATLEGSAEIEGDLDGSEVAASFDVRAAVEQQGENPEVLGTLDLVGKWDGRLLTAELRESRALGGVVSGQAALELEEWWKSRGELRWQGLDGRAFSRWFDWADSIEGSTRGSVTFAPAKDGNAHEPLRAEVEAWPETAVTYRGLTSGPARATLYGGPQRWVVDPLEWEVSTGQVRLWGSLRKHGQAWHDHIQADLTNLDLNEFYHALVAEPQRQVPGRLSGRVNAYGPLGHWTGHAGSARVHVSDSDLQQTTILGTVLSLVGVQVDRPIGRGTADLRLEGTRLMVDQFVYHAGMNELLLRAEVDDISLGKASPIQGAAVASARPIKGTGISVLTDLDRMMRAVQTNLTSVRIGGTLENPEVQLSTVAEVQGALRRIGGR